MMDECGASIRYAAPYRRVIAFFPLAVAQGSAV